MNRKFLEYDYYYFILIFLDYWISREGNQSAARWNLVYNSFNELIVAESSSG